MDASGLHRSADQLGIGEWERAGLQALAGPLARGELRVDMREYGKRSDAGTARRIGGWLAVRAGLGAERYVIRYQNSGKALEKLYFPDRYDLPCDHRVAAGAVVNFLTLGDPRWALVAAGRACRTDGRGQARRAARGR